MYCTIHTLFSRAAVGTPTPLDFFLDLKFGFVLNKCVCVCVYFCPADMQPLSWIPSRKGFTTQTPRPALLPGSKSGAQSEIRNGADSEATTTKRLSQQRRLLRWLTSTWLTMLLGASMDSSRCCCGVLRYDWTNYTLLRNY